MDLAPLVSKVLNIVSAVRAKDWVTVFKLSMDVLNALYPVTPTPGPAMMQSHHAASFASCETMDVDSIATTMETQAQNATATGPLIDALLPLIVALIKKLLIG